MLFYNHKQEFIGIDEDGLKLLNYDSLEALLEVCSDVADLFAKEPGYIHNFKNFGWIDFLLHADSDASSAIVHANGRSFSCMLQVQKLYLCAEPSQHGYMIEMLHVVPLSSEEIPSRILPTPSPSLPEPEAAEPEAPLSEPAPSPLPDYGYLTPTPLSEPGTLDIPAYEEPEFEAAPVPVEDLYRAPSIIEEEIAEELPTPPAPPVAEEEAARPAEGGVRFTPEEQKFIDELQVARDYRFDPNIAANELGLPVDLIEEFIGDFIQQSHDFRKDLFDAVMKGDMNNLKILSHKLKGVAANLRIEDAFECLSIINTSDDIVQIEANLKYFYGIVAKLEGKEISLESNDVSFASIPEEKEFSEPLAEAQTYAPFKESIELTQETEAAGFAPSEDDIYAFVPKNKGDIPSPAAGEEFPGYPSGLKDGGDESLTVQTEELYTMDKTPETFFEETGVKEAPASETPEQRLHYDKAAIAGQLGIETAFFDELIEDYKKDALVAGQQIADAIAAFDTLQWKKSAVQLKGISDNLRLNEISDELAVLIRTNDAQEAHKASKRLNSYLAQL